MATTRKPNLRRGTSTDFRAVFELVRAMTAEIAGPAAATVVEKQLGEDVTATLRGDPDDVLVVAERDSTLLGCGRVRVLGFHPMLRFGADPRHAYVELMYVVPEARGSGLSGQILTELERIAAKRGVLNVTLHHSPKARSFYERRGYTLLDEMGKRLPRPPSP